MANKIKFIIVDDEPIAREILENHAKKIDVLEHLASCNDGVEAISFLKNNEVDLVFLDINMPEISGITIAKTISSKTKIIFTTAYREFALEGFEVNAMDYLLKPISLDEFLKAVNKYPIQEKKIDDINRVNLDNENAFIFVRSERKMVKVNFEDILYLESLSDYVKIFTVNKIIITRDTIKSSLDKLPPQQFLRVHRSYVVNIKKIDSYTNEFIEIQKKAIPISRSYKELTLKMLENN